MLELDKFSINTTKTPTRVSVIIPAYNEATSKERRVAFSDHLSDWGKIVDVNHDLRVVIVNDGSSDETTKIVDEYGLPYISHLDGKNKGKGASLTLGLKETSGIRAFTDADGSYSPSFVLKLIQNIEDGNDIAVATRIDKESHESLSRRIGHTGLASLLELITPTGVNDVQGGAKALSEEAANALLPFLNINGYAWDRQLLYHAARMKLYVNELVVPTESFHAVGNSHIRIASDGIKMVLAAIKMRYN